MRPAASSARAAVCTSITWKGAISATRAASGDRESIESRRADSGKKALSYRPIGIDQRRCPKFVRCLVYAVIALRLCCAAAPGYATRCTNAPTSGDLPVYQDAPCPPGRELRNFAADPATVSVIPVAPGPAARLTRAVAPLPARRTRNASAADRKERSRGGDPSERRYIHPGMHEGEVLAARRSSGSEKRRRQPQARALDVHAGASAIRKRSPPWSSTTAGWSRSSARS